MMTSPCEGCGCTSAYEQLRLENQVLREKLHTIMLEKTSVDSESSVSSTEEQEHEMSVKHTKSEYLEAPKEHIKRLKADYDEIMKKNQELENRILEMADELQLEKSCFEETVGNMSEQLMDLVEKMNKMEKEYIKTKKDCSLVVQLLKCNQSLDRTFVSKKLQTMPSDLKEKLTLELDLTPEHNHHNHATLSRKLWRTKSASSASTSSPSELSDAE